MFKKVKENKKGFTLAELLIVVAIIAVLVAVSIPIFTGQLEKARQATTAANLRAAYAEAATAVLTYDDGAQDGSASVTANDNGTYTVAVANVNIEATSTGSADLPFTNSATLTVGNGQTATFSITKEGVATLTSVGKQ